MLAAAGARISRDGGAITIEPAQRLEAGDVAVPGDFSSAAFFIAAALIVPSSEVSLREVGINRTRIGLLSILARMGVEMGGAHEPDRAMVIQEIREPGPEPMASLRVRSARLRGPRSAPRSPARSTSCRSSRCSDASPRARPSSAAPRSCASRRRTESTRWSTASARSAPRSVSPTASSSPAPRGLRGGTIDARGDHRMAMLGAIGPRLA